MSRRSEQTLLKFHEAVRAFLPTLRELHAQAHGTTAEAAIENVRTQSPESLATAREWDARTKQILFIAAEILNTQMLTDDDRLRYQKLIPALPVVQFDGSNVVDEKTPVVIVLKRAAKPAAPAPAAKAIPAVGEGTPQPTVQDLGGQVRPASGIASHLGAVQGAQPTGELQHVHV